MITLYFQEHDDTARSVIDRLETLSLAFGREILAENRSIHLMDDDLVVNGVHDINQYLDQLEKELRQWHYCNC
jgi:hypothetical protein